RRRAHVVAGREEQARSGQPRKLLVEHRRQGGGAADRDVDPVVERIERRLLELAVEVGETDDRDRLDGAAALEDLGQDPALALLWLRGVEEVGHRRGAGVRTG